MSSSDDNRSSPPRKKNDISSDSGSSSEDHENSSSNSNNNQSASDTELDNYLSDHDDDDNIYSDNDHETISQINDNEISNLNTERASLLMLHENSSISVDQCVFDLLDYYIKHNISKSALAETLKMQLNILPQDNKMPKSVYKLFQYVHKIATPCRTFKHYYCKICISYIGSDSRILKCLSCNANVDRNAFFFEFDIISQIQYLFEYRQLRKKLNKPTLRTNSVISDIVDGSEYIRVNSRLNRGEYDLTLVLNTDGLSLVKSSKSHCWPLLCTIVELPYYLRESHIINLGLWLDKDLKPPMNIFLKPLSLKIQNAFESGIDWIDPETKERMTSKIVAPLFIADAPARASLQKVLNFNGHYGCNICEVRTVKSKRLATKKKRVRIYPADSNARLRDGERMIKQVEQLRAFQQQVPHLRKTHVRGVVGESILCTLPLLNLGTCLVPEYMHSVLLGVVKQLFNIYTNKSGPWSIKNSMSEINDFITNIRPPAYFNRLPRSLAQITYFKASEYYNLILFYALPALRDYLPQRYLQHLLTLIIALFNLLQNEITEDDLQEGESLLEIFINEVPILFSDRELTYNMHQLKHLVLCVRRWGPLQSTSAFCFENYNGYIASSVHGNKNMSQEIVNNVTIAQGICILKNRVASQNNDILETNSSTNYELLDGIDLKSTNFYTRAKINCDIYTSNFYKETKINNSNVKIKMNNCILYGLIRYFFEIQNEFYIILQTLKVEHEKIFFHFKTKAKVKHIIPVKQINDYQLIKLSDLESISQVIKVGDYICKRPNLWKQVW
ncbi:uncharacterized protein LOC141527332 [Cotesia typhae]|uniref:uncharacterized protein LOC141527332 n=1 Tax=Cotesia typhae TaxID=2053667 RepID=UPI003D690D6E